MEILRNFACGVFILFNPVILMGQEKQSNTVIDTYSYDWMETKILKLYSDSTFEFFTGNNHTRLRKVKSGTFSRSDSTITIRVCKGYLFGIPINTNVNNKIDQLLNLRTVVYADGYKCVVQSSVARIGLLHLSNRYNKHNNRSDLRIINNSILLFPKDDEPNMAEWEIRHNTLTRERRE